MLHLLLSIALAEGSTPPLFHTVCLPADEGVTVCPSVTEPELEAARPSRCGYRTTTEGEWANGECCYEVEESACPDGIRCSTNPVAPRSAFAGLLAIALAGTLRRREG